MAKKRFTDIEIWDKEWYMELKPVYKCLIKYMFDKCDACGCWKPNWKLASFHIGETVTLEDLKKLPQDQYEILESGKIWIPEFINFQYGQLSKNSPAHKPIFSALEKNNLMGRLLIDYQYPTNNLMDKDKEKDKEIIKGGTGEKVINVNMDSLCYDAEKYIVENELFFDKICIATLKDAEFVKGELHAYHLWLAKNEKYPTGKLAVIAGIESWILNGKKYGQQSINGSNTGEKLGTSAARVKTARTW